MINTFRIGADPEFIMTDTGNNLHPMHECDPDIEMPDGTAGPDHCGDVAELRPNPAIGTYALVKRLGAMLTSSKWGKYRNFRWLAGPAQTVYANPNYDHHCAVCCADNNCDGEDDNESYTQPLGGHIHLDIRANDPRWDSVVEALDVQHRLFEDLELYPKEACEVRRDEGYGKFGWVTCNGAGNEDEEEGYRYEKNELDAAVLHGFKDPSKYHMEFRTPPSWLYHPRISMMALTSAKLAAADPEGTIEALRGKPIHLNTLTNWYERYKGKDANADRVLERILHGTSVNKLQFDTQKDLKDVWSTIDF